MKTKSFSLRTVLAVTTGRFICAQKVEIGNGIGDLYGLLNWMTNDHLMTHQLPRAANECKPWLLRWFPELAGLDAEVALLCDGLRKGRAESAYSETAIAGAIKGIGIRIGRHSFDVGRIPADDHEVKDPYDELVEMRGTDEGIVLM